VERVNAARPLPWHRRYLETWNLPDTGQIMLLLCACTCITLYNNKLLRTSSSILIAKGVVKQGVF